MSHLERSDQPQLSQVRGLLYGGELRIIYSSEERPVDSRRVRRGRLAKTLRLDDLFDIVAHLTSQSLEEVKSLLTSLALNRNRLAEIIGGLLKKRGLLEVVSPWKEEESYRHIRGYVDQVLYIVDGLDAIEAGGAGKIAFAMELDELYNILARLKDLSIERVERDFAKEMLGETLEAQKSVLIYEIRKLLISHASLMNRSWAVHGPIRIVEGRISDDGKFQVRIDRSLEGPRQPMRYQWREAGSVSLTSLYEALASLENTTLEAVEEAYNGIEIGLRRETVIRALKDLLLR